MLELAQLLGPLVGAIAAIWAFLGRRKANKKADALAVELTETQRALREMNREMTESLETIVSAVAPSGVDFPGVYIGQADVTNDGHPELLIQSGAGAHSSFLRVFGSPSPEFYVDLMVLGELFSDMAFPFLVEDWDSDGRLEIAYIAADSKMLGIPETGGRPYANVPVIEHVVRWEDDAFRPVSSERRWDPVTEEEPPWFSRFRTSPPSWAGRLTTRSPVA